MKKVTGTITKIYEISKNIEDSNRTINTEISVPKVTGTLTRSHEISASIGNNNRKIDATINTPDIVSPSPYEGDTEFTPTWETQTIETANRIVKDDISILSIQTYETSNEAGGITFII